MRAASSWEKVTLLQGNTSTRRARLALVRLAESVVRNTLGHPSVARSQASSGDALPSETLITELYKRVGLVPRAARSVSLAIGPGDLLLSRSLGGGAGHGIGPEEDRAPDLAATLAAAAAAEAAARAS